MCCRCITTLGTAGGAASCTCTFCAATSCLVFVRLSLPLRIHQHARPSGAETLASLISKFMHYVFRLLRVQGADASFDYILSGLDYVIRAVRNHASPLLDDCFGGDWKLARDLEVPFSILLECTFKVVSHECIIGHFAILKVVVDSIKFRFDAPSVIVKAFTITVTDLKETAGPDRLGFSFIRRYHCSLISFLKGDLPK